MTRRDWWALLACAAERQQRGMQACCCGVAEGAPDWLSGELCRPGRRRAVADDGANADAGWGCRGSVAVERQRGRHTLGASGDGGRWGAPAGRCLHCARFCRCRCRCRCGRRTEVITRPPTAVFLHRIPSPWPIKLRVRQTGANHVCPTSTHSIQQGMPHSSDVFLY